MSRFRDENFVRSFAIELSSRVGKTNDDIESVHIEDTTDPEFMIIHYKDGSALNVALVRCCHDLDETPDDATVH